MVLNNIEKLLKKYENGETTLKEEQHLKHYFAQEEVAPHLESYKAMFNYFQVTKQEQFTKDVPLKSRNKNLYKWISVAAVAVLMVSVFTFTNKEEGLGSLNEEQLLAYNQTKEALSLLSSKFNDGASSLNALTLASQNLEKGVDHMSLINEFNTSTNKIFKTN